MSDLGSVSRLLGGLRQGDEEAIRVLWQRYYQASVRLAESRLSAQHPRVGRAWQDGEDIALWAFWNLCVELSGPESARRFPDLRDRTQLWKLLACFVARHACDVARKEARRRRTLDDEGALGAGGFGRFVSHDPSPDFRAGVADLLECLPSDELRQIANAKMEGCTNEEVAQRLGRSLSTIERKLQVIRALWNDLDRNPS